MRRLLLLALTLLAGVAAGLAATYAGLRGPPWIGALRSGAWTAWPEAGTPGANPYVRARFARDGTLPLPTGVGLRFFARTDDSGTALDSACDTELAGPMPVAQYWTVTILGPDGLAQAAAEGRTGFTSSEVVRDADGRTTVTVGRQARPGNWLPVKGTGPFTLMVSLYDSPLGTAPTSGSPTPPMPTLRQTRCR